MIDVDYEKRRRFIAFNRYYERYKDEQEQAGLWLGQRPLPRIPDDLRDLTCGAKTRKGKPCKRRDLYSNGRCRLHGGLSTGPRTEVGRQQSRINGRKGGRPRMPEPQKSLVHHGVSLHVMTR